MQMSYFHLLLSSIRHDNPMCQTEGMRESCCGIPTVGFLRQARGLLGCCEVTAGVLGHVVAADETLEAYGTGEPLLPCVSSPVAGQFIGADKLPLTAVPPASERLLT